MTRRLAPLARLGAAVLLVAGLGEPSRAQSPDADAAPQDAPAPQPAAGEARGNPLWGIPLQSLSATRERPLFSPTRRPPPSAEPAPAPAAAPPAAVAGPSPPPRPPLALIGTVVGPRDGFAIFLDQSSNTVMRLRTGEAHLGWTLKQVSIGGVLLQMDRRSAELALPPPDAAAMAAQSGVRRRQAERPFASEPDPSSH